MYERDTRPPFTCHHDILEISKRPKKKPLRSLWWLYLGVAFVVATIVDILVL